MAQIVVGTGLFIHRFLFRHGAHSNRRRRITEMLFSNRLLLVGLLSVGISAATPAQAGEQLFDGSWIVKSFGNERTTGTAESAIYSAWAMPQGILCNPQQPRCPFPSTPTDGAGNFNVLGGSRDRA
ncbi:MAG: hypothetical protein V3V86_00020, partial [Gammaproteobacteria bacterium]